MPVRYDAAKLRKAARTTQGYVRADAYLGRTGIQVYRQPDGTERRELRHPDDVFAPPALSGVAGLPITVGHPGLLTPANTHEHRVGGVLGEGRAEAGRYLAAQVQIEHADTIARIDSGELCELSLGYTVDLDETPGQYEGQPYHARQRAIVLNHVALLPKGGGRAGADVRLRLDAADACAIADTDSDVLPTGSRENMKIKIRLDSGVEVEVEKEVAEQILAYRDQIAAADKRAGKLDGDIAAANARADAAEAAAKPEAIQALVTERVALESAATKVLGDEYSCAGKTSRQVHEDALRAVDPTAKFDGRADAYLAGRFDSLLAASADPNKQRSAVVSTVVAAKTRTAETREDAEDLNDPQVAYQASVRARADAWKPKAK